MNELQRIGLWGDGLILIDSPEMVSRYNACLESMGLPKTRKRKFHIDCMGWSPEIAQGIDDNYYLSQGEANPFAIILTPKQRYAPIYFPFHSYDWALMRQWFDTHAPQIMEITKSSGIWLDIDQEVESYQDAEDLLMVDGVIVRAKTPLGLMQRSHLQKKLVRNINTEQNVAIIGQHALQLVESAKDIGDMRRKHVVIDDMQFSDVCIFYTRAFGGTFVLCSVDSHKKDEYFVLNKNTAKRSKGVESVIDRKIMTRLEELGLISYDLDWWQNRYHRLKIIRDSFLMEALDEKFPKLDFLALNSAKQKGIMRQISDELPVEYVELKRLIYILEKGKVPKHISDNVKPFFAHPSNEADGLAIEVLWHVLTLVCDGRQVVRLYRQDKDEFYTAYDTWKIPRQTWARKMIDEYYQHRMMKK